MASADGNVRSAGNFSGRRSLFCRTAGGTPPAPRRVTAFRSGRGRPVMGRHSDGKPDGMAPGDFGRPRGPAPTSNQQPMPPCTRCGAPFAAHASGVCPQRESWRHWWAGRSPQDRKILAVFASAIVVVIAAAVMHTATSQPNWYANGKNYSATDQGGSADLIGVTPQSWCTDILVSYGVPGDDSLNQPLNAPGDDPDTETAQQWITGCVAGYYASH